MRVRASVAMLMRLVDPHLLLLMLLSSNPHARHPLPNLPQQHIRRVVPLSTLLRLPLPPIRLLNLLPPRILLLLRFLLARERIVTHDLNDEPPSLYSEPNEIVPSLAAAAETAEDGELRAGRNESAAAGRGGELGEGEEAGVAWEEGGEGGRGRERGEAEDGGDGVGETGQERGGGGSGREV